MFTKIIINFLDTYNLPWLILALMTWSLIYISCSLKQFFYALPVGIWTMVVGTILENFFIYHKFWSDHFILVHIGELDLFLIIGPFLSIGLLLIRFLPKSSFGKYMIILLFSAISVGIELIAIKLGFLSYNTEKWSLIHSLGAYSLSLMSGLGFYYIYYNK